MLTANLIILSSTGSIPQSKQFTIDPYNWKTDESLLATLRAYRDYAAWLNERAIAEGDDTFCHVDLEAVNQEDSFLCYQISEQFDSVGPILL